jgi:hypothetical protein
MGLNLDYVLYLQRHGYLRPDKNALFDLGSQNVWYATPKQIRDIISNQGQRPPGPTVIDELVARSVPQRGVKQTLFSEIAALAGIDYYAFGVQATDLLDLNVEMAAAAHTGRYDVVLNFGATEHILNQVNSFKVLHDVTKIGGVIYCRLPATGYFEQGYFCYTPLFFRDLARNNDYEIVDMFLTMAGRSNLKDVGIQFRSENDPYVPRDIGDSDTVVAYFDLHVVLRRCSGAPFQLGLEVTTSHAAIDPSLLARHSDPHLQQRIEQLRRSASWRITAPLRLVNRAANGLTRPIHRVAASTATRASRYFLAGYVRVPPDHGDR